MSNQFWGPLAAAAIIAFGASGQLLALDIAPVPASVDEAPVIGTGLTQYTVHNTSTATTAGGPFDVALLLVTTNGATPTTSNANWSAQLVDATSWDQNMVNEGLTWHQYTGLSYTQAFPTAQIKENGYFLNYTYNSDTGNVSFPASPIGNLPGTSLGGFFFQGSPGSTFFVAGPTDGVTSFAPGNVVTYSALTTDVPEPASLAILGTLAVCTLGARRRRRRQAV